MSNPLHFLSMTCIRILSDHTINKIAAGEVIENPSSVVKELVENSLDAGATEIEVEIRGGGRQLMRISDNGCGMQHDDALLSLERHATSKIKEVEQILAVATMGFRGEAIPSIAAISKFTLLTRHRDDEKGTVIVVEGGRICKAVSSEREPGTTIEVRSLFYNVAVRRKFQRSPSYDQIEIKKVITKLALANPSVTIRLISGPETLLNTRAATGDSLLQNLRQRATDCLGRDFVDQCVDLEWQQDGITITALLGKPEACHSNKTGQHLFVNGRAVTVPLIAKAVADSYGTLLPPRRHPIFLLKLTLPGDSVDVNVHPQKREVRLRHALMIQEALLKAGQKAFQSKQTLPALPPSLIQEFEEEVKEEAVPISLRPFDFSISRPSSLVAAKPINTKSEQPSLPIRTQQHPDLISRVPGFLLCKGNAASFFGLDQEKTAWMMVDQKRAHARILYETLQNEKQTATEQLLIPEKIVLSEENMLLLQDSKKLLENLGISSHQSGSDTLIVTAVNASLKGEPLQPLLEKIAAEISAFGKSHSDKHALQKQKATLATKAAVSRKRLLNQEEAQLLLEDLVKCTDKERCPFGQPIAFSINPETLSLNEAYLPNTKTP